MEYSDETKFFTWDRFNDACALCKESPMDFKDLKMFLLPARETHTLLSQPPNLALYGKLLGLSDARDTIQLCFHPKMLAIMGKYVEYYAHEHHDSSPPHPATLYNKLQWLQEVPSDQQNALVEAAVQEWPYDSIPRSIEFAYRTRQFLLSEECAKEFPTVADIRKLSLLGFTFLVVSLLTAVHQDDSGYYVLECDFWDEEARDRWERDMLMGEYEEQFRGRQRERF